MNEYEFFILLIAKRCHIIAPVGAFAARGHQCIDIVMSHEVAREPQWLEPSLPRNKR